MREKKKKRKVDLAAALGFDPADWEIDIKIGKSFLHNPTNARSCVGVRITHLPSGRVRRASVTGQFTKATASAAATELVQREMARLKQELP